jgi:hypothetical protein
MTVSYDLRHRSHSGRDHGNATSKRLENCEAEGLVAFEGAQAQARPNTSASTTRSEREILQRAVHPVTEQAAKADDVVDEALDCGDSRSDPFVTPTG